MFAHIINQHFILKNIKHHILSLNRISKLPATNEEIEIQHERVQ